MSRWRSLRSCVIALAVGLAVAVSGCEPTPTTITGVITLDGRAMEGVNVVFEPVEPSAEASTVSDETGRYALGEGANSRGPRPGPCRVRLFTSDHDPPPDQPLVVERIPAAYHSVIHFHVDVEPGYNRIDFELSDKPPTEARQEEELDKHAP